MWGVLVMEVYELRKSISLVKKEVQVNTLPKMRSRTAAGEDGIAGEFLSKGSAVLLIV